MSSSELLGSHKVFEILVVSEDNEGQGRVLEEVSPFFEAGNDGEEFFVIDFIVSFSGLKLAREEGDGSKAFGIIFGVLGQHTTNSIVRGVSF